MSENILLAEANYKDKFPPLGLMKIATFHKLKGDNVIYSREFLKEKSGYFSKIYIATRFSFHWDKTKELIKYYQKNFNATIMVGGIHASINPNLYKDELGIIPHVGSLYGDINSILNKISKDEFLSMIIDDIKKHGIDILPPDYSIFYDQELPFNNILKDNYLLNSTKGCIRNCSFCDVKRICEGYIEKLPVLPIINYIDNKFGSKTNIIFFDDNTLVSNKLEDIILDLKKAGFKKRARVNRKLRSCDFNQGMDLRLLNNKKIDLLNNICINPIRFAFDDISMKKVFIEKIKSVIDSGISNISVYVLYNYNDTPQDFYERLSISANFNNLYNCRIFSFPMKYVPSNQIDRNFVGRHWNKRMLRSVQCILNGCHGIVPVKYDYFLNAFGKNVEEFLEIIQMPEKYIVNRTNKKQEIIKWKKDFYNISDQDKKDFKEFISDKPIYSLPSNLSKNTNIFTLLGHYLNEKY